MLVEKYHPQTEEDVTSPRALLQDIVKPGKTPLIKFPSIKSISNPNNHILNPHTYTPKNNISSHHIAVVERPHLSGDENGNNRGPKIYGRNLPDVFIPSTPGTKKLR
jgi:hypothetical protein